MTFRCESTLSDGRVIKQSRKIKTEIVFGI